MSKIAIVFPDNNLPYSPTTLNLFRFLKQEFETSLFAIAPANEISELDEDGIHYIKRLTFSEKLFYSASYFVQSKLGLIPTMGRYRYKRQKNLLHDFKAKSFDKIIAIDPDTYWSISQYSNEVYFLSLEIIEHDILIKYLNKHPPKGVIIQSKIRYKFYFPKENVQAFYLPNSPNSIQFQKREKIGRNELIYNGAVIEMFGLKKMLEFVNQYPIYKLTLKGVAKPETILEIEKNYDHLLQSKNLVIDTSYEARVSDLFSYISQYRIGFCFYDKDFPFINSFNYSTAPSGKLFTYLASGVPVICSGQIGLKFVEENNCGVCVEELTPVTILEAIAKIELSYERYAANALKHFEMNAFDKKVAQIGNALR